jgi:serine/threonine-protein kinase
MSLNIEPGASPVPGYRLIRKLGQGGFGTVWEAEAPGGVRVALKFIQLDAVPDNPELRALDVIRNIRHPHLLDIQFAVREDDTLVIAMPLCERSLNDRLRECQRGGQRGLPREELMGYMTEVGAAVDFLNEPRHEGERGHRVGIQHRDIKPHNIFIVGGSVRLADFGLAKIIGSTAASHSGSMTPHYVSPEQIDGRVSPWSDQYSLAATYVHLRTGHLPFRGTASELLSGHLHQEPDLLGLADGERAVVARALAKDPKKRWPNCRAFAQALDAAALAEDAGPTPTTRAPDTITWKPPARRLQFPLRGVIAGVIVLVLIRAGAFIIPRVGGRTTPNGPGPTNPQTSSTLTSDPRKDSTSPPRPPAQPAPDGKPPAAPETPAAAADAPATANESQTALAAGAHALLKQYCYRCHGVRFEKPPLNVLDRDILTAAPSGKRKKAYIVPGKPDDSFLWQRVGVDEDMPPEDPAPSDAERGLLKRWIEAGAPFPVRPESRPFLGEKEVLAAIRGDLEKTPTEDRRFRRYFTLANLHNNRKVGDDDLAIARAAIAKVVNSLSWKPKVAVPQVVDSHATILAIDLRDFGWDDRLWQAILARKEPPRGQRFDGARDEQFIGYPYGLTHGSDRDIEVRRLAEEVAQLTACQLAYIRADWFIATASRPPLYETILGLPQGARDLERRLDVDVQADFLRDRLARAGFASSGVSSHNRMVERHDAAHGAYWKSYDFKADATTAELARFPLGPVFAGNPFERQAFEHAGGELIFNLPNGLQGYLLVNNKDERIEAGPIDIVADSLRTSGTATIVNGLSCMACHKNGMIGGFKDEVRAGNAVAGDARVKVERLYAARTAMDKLLADDEARFVVALQKATGEFFHADASKAKAEFPEPIGAMARDYVKDLDADQAAAELGLKEASELQAAIRANPELRRLGLGPLLDGGKLKRAAWESLNFFNSPFQNTAAQLELGTPFHLQ